MPRVEHYAFSYSRGKHFALCMYIGRMFCLVCRVKCFAFSLSFPKGKGEMFCLIGVLYSVIV